MKKKSGSFEKIGKSIDDFSHKFWGTIENFIVKYQTFLFLGLIFILGVGIRWFFMPYLSGDYIDFLLPWTNSIIEHGGILSMGELVGNYTPPYMLIMSIISYIPVEPVFTIKAVSILGDIVLAIACYFLVKKLTGSTTKAQIACAMVFVLPTVILNSSAWGQCDSIYVSFLIWFLYFVFSDKLYWAGAFFGIAFAFKLQTVFLVPFLVLIIVMGKMKLRHLLPGFLSYFLLFSPSIIMGEGISVLWDVYLLQSRDTPERVNMGAANLYEWLSTDHNEIFMKGFILFGLSTIAILLYWLWLNRKYIDTKTLFYIVVLFSIVVPYVLPKMHERYFYLADILSVIFALFYTKKWYVAVIIELISFGSYFPFLFKKTIFSLAIIAPLYIIPIAAVSFCIYNHFSECKNIQSSKPSKPSAPLSTL